MSKHISLTCPVCKVHDKAVGDPAEHLMGHYGGWYCFSCGASGNYAISFQVKGLDEQEGGTDA